MMEGWGKEKTEFRSQETVEGQHRKNGTVKTVQVIQRDKEWEEGCSMLVTRYWNLDTGC
jgi:hypothetical protein